MISIYNQLKYYFSESDGREIKNYKNKQQRERKNCAGGDCYCCKKKSV